MLLCALVMLTAAQPPTYLWDANTLAPGASLSYSSASTTSYTDYITIQHKKASVNVAFGFTTGGSAVFNPSRTATDSSINETINYNLYDLTSNIVTNDINGTGANFTDTYASTNSYISHSYAFTIEVPATADSPVPAGTYVDSVTFEFYDSYSATGVNTYGAVYTTQPYNITINVTNPSTQSLTLVAGTTYFSLVSGIDIPSTTVATITEISNVAYDINIKSLNGSVLTNGTETVAYTATYAGNTIDLSSANIDVLVLTGASPTDEFGVNHELTIAIAGSEISANLTFGDYTDSITFTISAN